MPSLQISEDQIDYWGLVQHVDDALKSEWLHEYEELKQYPPRFSLSVTPTPHQVEKDLKTVVSVTGVDPPVGFKVFA